ncbi:MAG: hypothetical protein OHK0032_06890 [Thermodesulfovibrionales bacterium]
MFEYSGLKHKVENRSDAVSISAVCCLLLAACFLAGCAKGRGEKPPPVEFTRDDACKVCGMIIVDFPGAKAQIHYKNGRYDAFCSTLDMFLFYLQPDRPRDIVAIYVNDMGGAEGGLHPPSVTPLNTDKKVPGGETKSHPRATWIDARAAFYVYGGDIMGPMGESLVPFADLKDAEAYAKKHGGRILRFDEVKMDILRPR